MTTLENKKGMNVIFNQNFWWEKNYDAEVRRGNQIFKGVDRLAFIKACEKHQARMYEDCLSPRMRDEYNGMTKRIYLWKQYTSESVTDFQWRNMSNEPEACKGIYYVGYPERREFLKSEFGPVERVEEDYILQRLVCGPYQHMEFDRDNRFEVADSVLVNLLTKRYNRLKDEYTK